MPNENNTLDPRILKALQGFGLPTVPTVAMSPEMQERARDYFSPYDSAAKILEGGEATGKDVAGFWKLLTPGYGRAAGGLGVFGSGPTSKVPMEAIVSISKLYEGRDGLVKGIRQIQETMKHIWPTKNREAIQGVQDLMSQAQHLLANTNEEIKKMESNLDKAHPAWREHLPSNDEGFELGAAGGRNPPRNANESRFLNPGPNSIAPFWRALDKYGGNVDSVAQHFKISPATVKARMESPLWKRPEWLKPSRSQSQPRVKVHNPSAEDIGTFWAAVDKHQNSPGASKNIARELGLSEGAVGYRLKHPQWKRPLDPEGGTSGSVRASGVPAPTSDSDPQREVLPPDMDDAGLTGGGRRMTIEEFYGGPET